MLRARTLAALTLTVGACHSAPIAVPPLAVRGTFPVVYDGRISPLEAGDSAVPAVEPRTEAAVVPRQVVMFRTTWIELPLDDARALLPDLAANASDDDSSPRRLRGVGVGAGHVEPASLRAALGGLDVECVHDSQRVTIGLGRSAEVATLGQVAFVKGAHLSPAADSLLVDDVEVDVLQYGSRVRLGVEADDGALRIDVDWRETTPLRPMPVARTALISCQVPVLTRHRLTASTSVRGSDGFVVGSLPGAPGFVRFLCVEVEPAAGALTAR